MREEYRQGERLLALQSAQEHLAARRRLCRHQRLSTNQPIHTDETGRAWTPVLCRHLLLPPITLPPSRMGKPTPHPTAAAANPLLKHTAAIHPTRPIHPTRARQTDTRCAPHPVPGPGPGHAAPESGSRRAHLAAAAPPGSSRTRLALARGGTPATDIHHGNVARLWLAAVTQFTDARRRHLLAAAKRTHLAAVRAPRSRRPRRCRADIACRSAAGKTPAWRHWQSSRPFLCQFPQQPRQNNPRRTHPGGPYRPHHAGKTEPDDATNTTPV